MNFAKFDRFGSEATPTPSGAGPRVVVLTHSHPRLTRGGAEIAAAALVRGLRSHFDIDAYLVGCSFTTLTDRLGLNLTQPFGDDDFVYQASHSFDHFKFANRDAKFPKMFSDLIDELKPDILHFHHYAAFGVEAFAIAKRVRPKVRIVLTLHEYLAICHNHGQMVKTRSMQLCESESLIACSQCFPELAPRDFFLRKRYIQTFFDHVDLFISPSRFLAARYTDWGLAPEKIIVLENAPPPSKAPAPLKEFAHAPRSPSATKTTKRARVRIGFFGQMSPLKGVPVLLAAAKELAANKIANLSIEIFGDYSNQPPEFQKAVIAALAEAGQNVRYHGPYDNANVDRLMRSVDAVVVPSIWWENAPVVIEEALTNERPVICSNIGGMAEAVRDGVDGLWFSAGDSMSLAETLTDIAETPEILTRLRKTMRKPRAVAAVEAAHLDAYRRLLQPQASGAPAPTHAMGT